MERVLLVHAGPREMRKNANLGDRTREVFGEKCKEEREAGRNGGEREKGGENLSKMHRMHVQYSQKLNHNERMLFCYLGAA